MKLKAPLLTLALLVGLLASAACADDSNKAARKPIAMVFDGKSPLMMQDDFTSSPDHLRRWMLDKDDQYDQVRVDPDRISVVDAPGLPGVKAVRLFVPRAPNSFRAEIEMPSEKGSNERWYGERVCLSKDWVTDPAKGRTIVIQWHGVPGNFRATFPNLDISVKGDRWNITRSFGDPKTKPTRDSAVLDDPIQPGTWVSWVLHAKWSPGDDGLLQIWKDGKTVFERNGPNVYGTIGVEYTPYLQTGIYHPSWHLTNDGSRKAYQDETDSTTNVTNKTVYIADVKIGNERARYDDVAPGSGKAPAAKGQ